MKATLVTVLLAAAPALAQVDGGVPPPAPAPAAAAAPAPTAAPAPAAAEGEKDGWLQARLEALAKESGETSAAVKTMQRLKFSGYVQARYVYSSASRSGLTSAGKPAVTDGFSVRRGRLKAQYVGDIAHLTLQPEINSAGVEIKDAIVALTEPFSGHRYFTLSAGQMNWPFGYEGPTSSSVRELPERTAVVHAFSPGERDRGAKLDFKWQFLTATLGVFDGNGTKDKGYAGVDNDTEKDLYLRVAVKFHGLAAGVSASTGKTFRPATDTEAGRFFPRQKVGADLQASAHLLPIGATGVKLEAIAGTTYQISGVEQFGQSAWGWYGVLTQDFGKLDQLAFRYDGFTPATGAQDHTFGFAFAHHFDELFKASIAYELPFTQTSGGPLTLKQHLFTLQLQVKF